MDGDYLYPNPLEYSLTLTINNEIAPLWFIVSFANIDFKSFKQKNQVTNHCFKVLIVEIRKSSFLFQSFFFKIEPFLCLDFFSS